MQRGGAQQRALVQHLQPAQGPPRPAEYGAAVAADDRGGILGAADDVEGTLETCDDEVLLVRVVMVEGALGEFEPRGDLIDRRAAVAALVHQKGRRMQEGVATLLARCDCDRDVVPEACLPDRRVAEQAVPQYVDDAGGHAAIILRLIAVGPP